MNSRRFPRSSSKAQLDTASLMKMNAQRELAESQSKFQFSFKFPVVVLDILPGKKEDSVVQIPSDGDLRIIGFNMHWLSNDPTYPLYTMKEGNKGRPLQNAPVDAVAVATPGDVKNGGVRYGFQPWKGLLKANDSFTLEVENPSGLTTIDRFVLTWIVVKNNIYG